MKGRVRPFSRGVLKSRRLLPSMSNVIVIDIGQKKDVITMSSAFDWRAKAACRDKDPELFFPVGNTGAAYQQIEEAKSVCRTCKVIDACLKCALDTNQDYGVWGGLSEDERRALKRRAMRARRSASMQLGLSLIHI